MNPGCWRFGAVVVVAAVSVLCPRASGQGAVVGIGVFGPNGYSLAYGVSGDGQVVTGYAFTPSGERAVRWTAGGGLVNLGLIGGTQGSSVGNAVNADGSVIVGRSATPLSWPNGEAFRWTQPGGMVSIGVQPPPASFSSEVRGVSADGLKMVGYHNGKPTLWTQGVGLLDLVGLPGGSQVVLSEATAISADGAVVAGFTPFDLGPRRPWTWTQSGGVQPLALLNGFGSAFPAGASADGSVIVGRALIGAERAVRWTSTGIHDLGLLSGGTGARADAVSGDGSVIGGYGDSTLGNQRAFIWTAALGVVDLNLYLPSIGVSVDDWVLNRVTGISADGRTLVGIGMHEHAPGMTRVEGFIVQIPAPGALVVTLPAGVVGLRRRRG